MIQIKICGMRREEDIAAANALLPDYIGFVFAQSRRRVTSQEAKILRKNLDDRVGAVGVFVNAPLNEVAETAAMCSLCAVQLHGGEDNGYITALRPLLPSGCEIWRAARVKIAADIKSAEATGADRLLLDAYSPVSPGGTGTAFDWGLLASEKIDRPFFVAGGVRADNVLTAINAAKSCKKAVWNRRQRRRGNKRIQRL